MRSGSLEIARAIKAIKKYVEDESHCAGNNKDICRTNAGNVFMAKGEGGAGDAEGGEDDEVDEMIQALIAGGSDATDDGNMLKEEDLAEVLLSYRDAEKGYHDQVREQRL